MGRWRPPRKHGSAYITPEGAKMLRDELKHLWEIERPKVTQVVHEAAKNGDRSENGDYIYGKKRLREIDSRVRFLSKRLEHLKVIDALPENQETVYFGAWVTVENEDGEEATYRIVGPDEFSVAEKKVSVDSPFAKALLGKRLDDEITFNSPTGEQYYVITQIVYAEPLGSS